jgi:hypothetical protein
MISPKGMPSFAIDKEDGFSAGTRPSEPRKHLLLQLHPSGKAVLDELLWL